MREILFRGKRVDNNEWVEGFYSPIRLPIVGEMGHFINEDGYRAIEIKKETVCEYTGLTDKNGKKIFEGDIVRGKDCIGGRREGSVFYDNYNAMYMIKPNTKSEYREVNCLTSLKPAEAYLEVIGNIHDNPELLKEDEK